MFEYLLLSIHLVQKCRKWAMDCSSSFSSGNDEVTPEHLWEVRGFVEDPGISNLYIYGNLCDAIHYKIYTPCPKINVRLTILVVSKTIYTS